MGVSFKSKPGDRSALRGNYLSTLENVAQAVGTMGPAATLGTLLPLLISKTGNATWLLFIGVLAVFILISASITTFASRYASAGSLAAFARMGLGPWPGVVTGWSYVIAMAFVVASSGISSAYYLAMVWTHFTGTPVSATGAISLVVLVVVMAWWPAYRDVKLSTKVMLLIEAATVGLILLIIGLAMFRAHHWVDHDQLQAKGAGFTQIQVGFVLAFMMLAGFESSTTLGEEAKTATSTIPRVMLFCLLPVGLLFAVGIYCLTALSHTRDLALDQASAPMDILAQSIGLPTLGWVSSLGVALSCFGCAMGGFNAGSRVLFSMARSGQCWAGLAKVHAVNATPYRALAFFGVVALAAPVALLSAGVTMAGCMDYLMQIASLGFIGGYFAVCLAAPVYLARRGLLTSARMVIAVVTLAVIATSLGMSVFPIPDAPWRYLPYIFVGLLLAGSLVSAWCLRSRRAEKAGNSGAVEFPEAAEAAE